MPTSKRTKHGSGKRYTPKPVKYDPKYTRELRDGLREKLHTHLTLAELAEMEKQIQQAVEKAEQLSVIETHNRDWAIVFRVLHDRFGFESDQKRALWDSALEYLIDLREKRITVDELLDTLYNEDGISINTTWEDLE